MIRFEKKNWLIATIVLATLASLGQTYLLIDDLNEVESSPSVAIIYPRAIGPEISKADELDDLEAKESGESIIVTEAPASSSNTDANNEITTISLSTTTNTNTSSEPSETETTSASSIIPSYITSTTTTTAIPDVNELPASASAQSSVYISRPGTSKPVPAVNRIWHFNNRGVNSEASWSRFYRDSEAVESNSTPIYTTINNSPLREPGPVFVRKPMFSELSAESNGLTAEGDLATGENPLNNQRNLYYPDINRIQTPAGVPSAISSTSTSASASASASASSSSSASANTGFQASASNINAAYGTKGGDFQQPSPFLGNTWQPNAPQIQSPIKAIRKVVLKSAKTLNEDERSQGIYSNQQPYRVRVVVQPDLKTSMANNFQNNHFERIQDASSSASAAASSSSRSSSSSFSRINTKSEYTNQIADRKEFTEVNSKLRSGTKSLPLPPPAAVKTPPKPAPIKQAYSTKTPVKAAIRAPVFEQEYEKQHYEEHNPEPEPYSFNFNVNDDSGNGQFRREEGDRNGVVRGSYGYTDSWGLYRIVDYVADKNGFRATIRTNEPGLVERNPITNEVSNPAHIQVAAEETPAKVVELMRLKKPSNSLI